MRTCYQGESSEPDVQPEDERQARHGEGVKIFDTNATREGEEEPVGEDKPGLMRLITLVLGTGSCPSSSFRQGHGSSMGGVRFRTGLLQPSRYGPWTQQPWKRSCIGGRGVLEKSLGV